MTDYQVAIWLTIVLAVEFAAVGIAFHYVFAQHDAHLHIMQKIGFALAVFGLVVQIVRSMHYLEHGFYPVDKIFPMWVTKDIGICVLIYYYSFLNKKA